VRALTSHGYGIEDEAVRASKKGPRWSPETKMDDSKFLPYSAYHIVVTERISLSTNNKL
jgi:hypothetical protein